MHTSSPQPRIGIGCIVSDSLCHDRHSRYAENSGTRRPCEYCGSLIHLSANTPSMGRYAQPRTTASAPSCHTAPRDSEAEAGEAKGVGLIDIHVPVRTRRTRVGSVTRESKEAGFWPRDGNAVNPKLSARKWGG